MAVDGNRTNTGPQGFAEKVRNTDFVRRDCSCMDLRFGHDDDCAGPDRPYLTGADVEAMAELLRDVANSAIAIEIPHKYTEIQVDDVVIDELWKWRADD